MPIDWRELDPTTAEKIRRDYLHIERSKQQLQKDLTIAFDQIHELKCRMRSQKLWNRVQGSALVISGGVIAWLASHLYDCISAVHAVMR